MSSPDVGAEQAERAQHDAGRAHRDGVHGGEAGVERGGDEPGPPCGRGFQVGDRDGLTGGVALHARALVGLQLEEFQFAGLLGGGGQQAQLVERVGEQKSGGGDVEQLGAALGEFGQQVHHVEVLEQGVDERDDRVQHAGFTRGFGHFTLRPWVCASVGLEPESAVEDVAGDVGGAAAGGVGVGAQADQGLGGLDLQLGDEHAGGLADLGAGQGVEFGPGVAVGVGDGGLQVVVEEVEQRDAGQLGGDDGAGDLLVLQAAGLGAEQVEGADVFTGDDDGHREDAADLEVEHGGAVDGPARVVGVGEIDDQDGRAPGDRIQARALAEEELELVVHAGGFTAGSEGSAVGAVEDQGDRRRVDVEEHHARLTQPVGGIYPTAAVDSGEKLLVDRHI